MAMSVGASSDVMVEMNTTPLIDVMLVLLIMLIVTIPVQSHAVKLDMPQNQANSPPPEFEPEIINIEVDFDGSYLWNGSPISLQQLRYDLQQKAKQDPQPEVHINPNKLAKYDHVATVLASAQRLGILKIGLVGNEQFFGQ